MEQTSSDRLPHRSLFQESIANITASAATTAVNHPISTMRNLLIVSDGNIRNSMKQLNTRVLFSGLPTYMASAPIFAGMGSLSHELKCRALQKKGKLSLPESLMIPIFSGVIFAAISQPIDYTVYHQSLRRKEGLKESVHQVFKRLYKNGGASCFYRGLSLTTVCYTNSSLVLFGLGPLVYYQAGKRLPTAWEKVHPLASSILCGCLGALGSSVIHPVDTVKLQYQKDYRGIRYTSVRDTVCKIYAEKGVAGFYRLWMMRLLTSFTTSFVYATARNNFF